MPREYYPSEASWYGREQEERAAVVEYRAAAYRFWADTGTFRSSLAEWVCSDRWTDTAPFVGRHDQAPVSGECGD